MEPFQFQHFSSFGLVAFGKAEEEGRQIVFVLFDNLTWRNRMQSAVNDFIINSFSIELLILRRFLFPRKNIRVRVCVCNVWVVFAVFHNLSNERVTKRWQFSGIYLKTYKIHCAIIVDSSSIDRFCLGISV